MKSIMKHIRFTLSAVALCCATLLTLSAQAQAAAATGSIHGHVVNAIGIPENGGVVKLTTDRESEASKRKFDYSFPVDANGNYKGADIKPNDYLFVYFKEDKSVDFIDHVVIKAGADVAQDDDMTREEYQKTLTEEQKKQFAEIKQKNAAALAVNAKVGNVNALLTKAREEMKSGNNEAALADMTQAASIKGDEAVVQFELGEAQSKNKKYDDAIVSYQKAIDLNAANKKPATDIAGASYSQMGLAYAYLDKPAEAATAFDKAASVEPAKAGQYYYNAAAILLNKGKTDEAGAAVDKAIAADPNRAESYYIKGQTLIGKSTIDSKTQKIVPPDGCVEAYSRYLELEPNGKHAPDVKAILAGFDEKIINDYKAGRSKKK